jgi:hypothetical protein
MTFKKVKERFRTIIAGSRGFNDYTMLADRLDQLLRRKEGIFDIVIVSGTAKGADQLGERYAKDRGYKVERYPADWDKYGKSAGYLRNAQMADNAEALVAFWDGESRGTRHMIDLAEEKGLEIRVIRY